jgi:type II secretory pathway component PulM
MRSWAQLNVRDRRAVLVGGLVLVSALAFRFVVKPYLHTRAQLVQRVAEQEALLHRELALLQSAHAVTSSVAEATRSLERVRPRLLDARDAFGATAVLVGTLGDDARRHGVLIEAIDSRPPESVGGDLTAVQVDVRGRGDLEGLLRWLHAIESGDRLLRVEQLSLARIESGATADSADTETLAFALSVRGFTMARAATSGPRVVAATTGVAP